MFHRDQNPNQKARLSLITHDKLGKPECPYAERWAIDLGRLGSFRIHRWFRSDDKRNPHDHPSDFITLVLKGAYTDRCTIPLEDATEPAPVFLERMTPGTIRRRKAEHRHVVDVDSGGCWTLLYFWPKRRDWGFWVPRKLDGRLKFMKSNKYFLTHGHHPCDQP